MIMMEKDYITSTAARVSGACADLGKKLKLARLAKNLTQDELAKLIGCSRARIVTAERGQGTTEIFVAIMIALKFDQALEDLIPEDPRSPLEKLKSRGRQRERASGNSSYAKDAGLPEW